MESVGFKEWALVCEAMGRGQQSIILRKGGIAEGRDGFAFRHAEFFLFPTFFHEQIENVRVDAPVPDNHPGEVEIRFFAKFETAITIESKEVLAGLEPLHVLKEAVVVDRFNYGKGAGLNVAFVRIFRLTPEWRIPELRSYGGCRSWVDLPLCPGNTKFAAVLADEEHRRRADVFNQLLRPGLQSRPAHRRRN